jgi:thiamine-monophosphate kinase
MPTLREIGEIEAVSRLRAARLETPGVVVGPGDDAAVLRPPAAAELVATTDVLVEGRHYRSDWIQAAALGERLVAANLSDLAAMAARPLWALVSIGARSEHDIEDLLRLQAGIARALEAHDAAVVGGNLAAVEGAEWFALTLLGEVEPGCAWTRSGARPGDLIAVSGAPGRAGAAVRLLQALGIAEVAQTAPELLLAWSSPADRIELAGALSRAGGVTAAIDISDGMAGDLAQLCEASGVGAELDERAWPADAALALAAERLDVALDDLRFGPSDDYELLLAVDPASRDACGRAAADLGVPLAVVGRFTEAPGVLAWRTREGALAALPGRGYDHFGSA